MDIFSSSVVVLATSGGVITLTEGVKGICKKYLKNKTK